MHPASGLLIVENHMQPGSDQLLIGLRRELIQRLQCPLLVTGPARFRIDKGCELLNPVHDSLHLYPSLLSSDRWLLDTSIFPEKEIYWEEFYIAVISFL